MGNHTSFEKAALYNALKLKDWDEARRYLETGDERQCLEYVDWDGDTEILEGESSRRLLEYVDKDGWNALHLACYRNAPLDLLKVIINLSSASMIMAKNRNGRTPLHFALYGLCDEGIIMLLEACPRVASVANKGGQTPLHRAIIYAKSSRVIRALLEAHPHSVRTRNCKRETPLDALFHQWDKGLEKSLKMRGKKPNHLLNMFSQNPQNHDGSFLHECDIISNSRKKTNIKWLFEVTVLILSVIVNEPLVELPIIVFHKWLCDPQLEKLYPRSISVLMSEMKLELEKEESVRQLQIHDEEIVSVISSQIRDGSPSKQKGEKTDDSDLEKEIQCIEDMQDSQNFNYSIEKRGNSSIQSESLEKEKMCSKNKIQEKLRYENSHNEEESEGTSKNNQQQKSQFGPHVASRHELVIITNEINAITDELLDN